MPTAVAAMSRERRRTRALSLAARGMAPNTTDRDVPCFWPRAKALCDEGSAAGTGHSRAALAARATSGSCPWWPSWPAAPRPAPAPIRMRRRARAVHTSSGSSRPAHHRRDRSATASSGRARAGIRSRPTPGPPGTPLNSYEGDLRVTTPGTVISDVSVKGTVEILASDVTIRDSEVTTTDGNDGHNIWIGPGAGNVVIESTTLRGADIVTPTPSSTACRTPARPITRGSVWQMYNCTECWAGPGHA